MKLPQPEGRTRTILLALGALIGLIAFAFLLPKIGHVFEDLVQTVAKSLGQWAYLLVGGLAMLETAAALGFIAPGEFAVIIGGVLAAEGTLSIEILIGVVWVAIVIGDSTGFFIGRKLGKAFVERHGERFPTARKHFGRVEQLFRDHGGKSIFLGRWIGFARPLVPFTAGTSGMRYRTFLPYDVISAGIWGTTFCLLGYIFYKNFSEVTQLAGRGALILGVVVIGIVLAVRAVKQLKDPAERERAQAWIDRQAGRPALRPLARFCRWTYRKLLRPGWQLIAPPVRFMIARLTPGTLGIELTTLVAIAGVGAYVIFLQIGLVESNTTLAGDGTAIDFAQQIQSGLLTWIAKALGVIGSFPVVLLLTVGVVGYLFGKKRRVEAVTLALAFATTEIAMLTIKDSVARARPEQAIVNIDSYSYPSGHASLSVAFLAIAVLLARPTQSATKRIVLLCVGAAFTVLIGLSRVYLRVHYLSDVIGGWALGLTVFSALGAIALIVDYLMRAGPEASRD